MWVRCGAGGVIEERSMWRNGGMTENSFLAKSAGRVFVGILSD